MRLGNSGRSLFLKLQGLKLQGQGEGGEHRGMKSAPILKYVALPFSTGLLLGLLAGSVPGLSGFTPAGRLVGGELLGVWLSALVVMAAFRPSEVRSQVGILPLFVPMLLTMTVLGFLQQSPAEALLSTVTHGLLLLLTLGGLGWLAGQVPQRGEALKV